MSGGGRSGVPAYVSARSPLSIAEVTWVGVAPRIEKVVVYLVVRSGCGVPVVAYSVLEALIVRPAL